MPTGMADPGRTASSWLGRPYLPIMVGIDPQPDRPVFSPGGAWSWSGAEWLPTLSPDRRWRWNGRLWERWYWYRGLPTWFVRDTVFWLVPLTAWVAATAGVAAANAPTSTLLAVAAPLGLLSILSMLALGVKLGRRAMWRELGLACLAGTATFLAWYGLITITAPDPTGQNDHAAAIGTVILALPVLAFVSLIVGVGGLLGRTLRGRHAPS
jgi:hypothetical protein